MFGSVEALKYNKIGNEEIKEIGELGGIRNQTSDYTCLPCLPQAGAGRDIRHETKGAMG
jgi:hypothetical protein